MNFLAHLYLSGNDEQILMGNFIADAVKGKKALQNFPEKVQKGIIIHREIDFFMDNHEIVKVGMSRLRNNYPKFSGVIMDIFYDYFLAKNWDDYHAISLNKFTEKVYHIVDRNKQHLIGKSKNMFLYMKRDNWLLSYKTLGGIESVLLRMSHRINHQVPLHESVTELTQYYDEYESEFKIYFREIMDFISTKYNISLK